jgi:predicted kinase
MAKIFLISGACGSGKTTFANAYARHLVRQAHRTVYLIHGDDFHRGFIEPEDKGDFFVDGRASDQVLWEDILRFNWDCIIATAGRALRQGMDVVIDYIVEDELPRVRELAAEHQADLYYMVLTADAEELERRIRSRGDADLTERALFLKRKLEALPENRGHLFDNTGKTPEDAVREIMPEQYLEYAGGREH